MPAAAMALTSIATSRRISCAILVPSRMVAGMLAPGFSFRASARKSYTECAHQNQVAVLSPEWRVASPVYREPSDSRDSRRVTSMSYNAPHDCQGSAGNSGVSGVQAGARLSGEPGEFEVHGVSPGLRSQGRYSYHVC